MRSRFKLSAFLALTAIFLIGFGFALTHVLNASAGHLVKGIGKSAPVLSWGEVIGLLQVAVALCAVVIAPGLWSRLSDRVRGSVIAEYRPLAFHPEKGARAWRVFLRSGARHLGDLTVSIYPRTQGNMVVTSRTRTQEDGGLVFVAVIDRGRLEVAIDRFAPGRGIALSLLFQLPDDPQFHSDQVAVRVIRPKYEETLRQSGHALYLIHLRVAIFMLVYTLIYMILWLRIGQLAYQHS